MGLILGIFLITVWALVVVGVLTGTAVWCYLYVDALPDTQRRIRIAGAIVGRILVGIMAASIIAAAPFAMGLIRIESDNATHCGPGTRYQVTHSGKITYWACELP